ncbi:hypothetical protein [Rhizobium leguminosarum]|uniref:hypothetical protein n=1 Tax=Rhizobium leguminosarum TaxID=384 RepID=UPI001FDEB050|nr:hypothetical protein [Rhizobium leguminosarum]
MPSRGNVRVPLDQGCKLAAAIPNASFVPLESKNHVLVPDEACVQRVFKPNLLPSSGRIGCNPARFVGLSHIKPPNDLLWSKPGASLFAYIENEEPV